MSVNVTLQSHTFDENVQNFDIFSQGFVGTSQPNSRPHRAKNGQITGGLFFRHQINSLDFDEAKHQHNILSPFTGRLGL